MSKRPICPALCCAILLLVAVPLASAQPEPPISGQSVAKTEIPHPDYPEVFFLYGALGIGLAIFSSDDITQQVRDRFTDPFKISNAGIDIAYGLKAGFRNILQAEFRAEKGVGHKLYFDREDVDPLQVGRVDVEANIDSREWLVKVNPVFWLLDDPSIATYLVYGQGAPEYFGDLGIRFDDGDKTILGVEFAKLYRWYAASLSIEYHDLSFSEYDDETAPPIRGTWNASYFIIQATFSAGFGD